MIRNYFKIALRNLQRNRTYTVINVLGLALGICCSLLIFTLIYYHLQFDTFHKNPNRIYRIVTEFNSDGPDFTPGVPNPLGKAFRNDVALADKVARVLTFDEQLITLRDNNQIKKFTESEGISFVEPEYFDIMNFPLVQGNAKQALQNVYSVLLTERLAKKYFSEDNPIGKTIRLDNRTECKITGILKDLPKNTDRKTEIYISYETVKKHFDGMIKREDRWGSTYSGMQCFIRLNPNTSPEAVSKVFPAFIQKYHSKKDAKIVQYHLQPLADIHFDSKYDGKVEKKYLWAIGCIGVFLIITACVNFVNLATAQALKRSKEIGIRKVLGSVRTQLFWQFIAETGFVTVLAFLVAYLMALLALPSVNDWFGTQLTLNLVENPQLLIFIPLLAITVVFLSGSYPGLILSGFQPILALKGKLTQQQIGGFSLRRTLVVAQFTISQMLIIGTIVVASQMLYFKQTNLGFSKDAIVMLPIPSEDVVKMNSLRNRLSQIAGIQNASLCFEAPASENNNETDFNYDNRPEAEHVSVYTRPADSQYLSTFNIKLVAGRNIYPSDTTREYLVNETFIKRLNLKSPQEAIGKNLELWGKTAHIVGVVKDFHNLSFHEDIKPICIMSSATNYNNCAVKINVAQTKTLLPEIEKIWNATYPDFLYQYEFLDERIGNFYKQEDTLFNLIQVFAGIAIFISGLGLYGLVSFMAVQKTKEIGIRKVLGASSQQILGLFGKEFVRLVVIAFVISAPIAWWIMNNWLQDFKYKITIGPGIFVIAIVCTLFIALITVGYQSMKAAFDNPINSLRSE
ncbi:ABC transporter permease [Cytophagaceae bacterium YF14B1]|uniref:ABC transporter permease n=1 Tax=Xanthocytophaga flava TaxID=3048013 RepID=A0AAE3U6Y9_9BACT|nr:ABC transporter permease [Xanthocytophaga flavus]MDJ1481831.1 ABC transporter permease [Xanthocytophaga flavus]